MEVYTGKALDVEVTVKRISGKCSDRDKYRSICSDGKFHGSSLDMERHNALKLFNRSHELGFRYTTYVMDGNCKIVDKLNNENECANHMVKRGYNAVKSFGHFWTLEHELGRAQLKVRALLAQTGGSGTKKQGTGPGTGERARTRNM